MTVVKKTPCFRVITGVLNDPDGHDEYDEVYQDVFVDKTGRYQVVQEPRSSIDPATGNHIVVMGVVDNGDQKKQGEKPDRF